MSPPNHSRRPRRLDDEDRPHPLLWYLAGGRLRRDRPHRGVPTAATLRERRVVARENRDVVGFWGTVASIRRVRRTRAELAEVCGRVAGAEGPGKAEDGRGAEEGCAPHKAEDPAMKAVGEGVGPSAAQGDAHAREAAEQAGMDAEKAE
ncbi:hypothetical protein LTR53_014645 [Teratosphaeriaceae sp. CCFEE 6253]|nr:hypothetical protein LTR53_014645 [Teratosphaeriaceae sp. CCFEE 6253]